ncbi:MAG: glycerophosphodiester phosphodiesterase [Oxalobacteraceae bacterium]|nr:glycerophosphodiester phosphodiesterase [Oxalobacteraceae bacterium]
MRLRNWFFCAVFTVAATACSDNSPYMTLDGRAPLVIGHRGASGELPEHTLEAYKRAIELGADFVEPDLVLTKDGVMIARHEPMLDSTTDVASKFPESRKSTKNVDGVQETAFFASDFTLAEIKTLRAIQPSKSRPQQFNGQYSIVTLDEIISMVKSESARLGRTVGIYPEIKHSSFHAIDVKFGANVFEDKLVATLHAAFGNSASAPVFIQSFEVANLQYLKTKTNIKKIQLIDADDVKDDGSMSLVAPYAQPYDFVLKGDKRTFADLLTATGLDFVKTYADGIGPWKPYLVKTVNDKVERTGDSTLTINDRRVDGSTGVIELAHARGLAVHAYTFRNDASGYGFKVQLL